jgi:hypothetical protein
LPALLNARLYRAAWLPALAALALAALSLTDRTPPLSTTLAPNAFEGAWSMSELHSLAAEFPDRAPGSPGDDGLAQTIAGTIQALGPSSAGGFHVLTYRTSGQTVLGKRTLETVVASRPGTTSQSAVVVIAHRDAAAGSGAGLSGTAVLLGLARALATRETARTVALVSTSGGSGGDAGAAAFVSLIEHGDVPWLAGAPGAAGEAAEGDQSRPVDAAIVLGDLGSRDAAGPQVLPYSSGRGNASTQLVSTITNAIDQQAGLRARSPSVLDQFVHLTAPLTTGEQGLLNAAGVPSVTVSGAGEGPGQAPSKVSVTELEGDGAATLSAVEALDASGDVQGETQKGLVFAQKVLPGWAIRLLAAALLLPALVVAVDAAARVRRRREGLGRGLALALSCALPFLLGVLVVVLMGKLGLAGPVPAAPVPGGAVHVGTAALATMVLAVAAFGAGWLVWGRLARPAAVWAVLGQAGAGIGLVLVLDAVATIAWIFNPYAALLLVLPVHLWLLLAAPELRPPRRVWGVAVVLLGLCAPALVVVYYAQHLGAGALGSVWSSVLLLAGGHVGVATWAMWCVALGCGSMAFVLAVRGHGDMDADETRLTVSIRGPLSYAGPGSLGGTESALRR